MYHFRSFRSKTLLVVYLSFGWWALSVQGGCQRTNPGWISSDEEKEHSTAPLLSFLPGNEFMKQFYLDVENLNLLFNYICYIRLRMISIILLQVLILYQHPGTDLWSQYISNVMMTFKFGPRRQVKCFQINIFHTLRDKMSLAILVF